MEQLYSKLDRVCSQKSNQLSIESMENLLFMIVLDMPGRDVLYYKVPIKPDKLFFNL